MGTTLSLYSRPAKYCGRTRPEHPGESVYGGIDVGEARNEVNMSEVSFLLRSLAGRAIDDYCQAIRPTNKTARSANH